MSISESLKRHWEQNPERKEALSERSLGNKYAVGRRSQGSLSELHRKALSESVRGYTHTEQAKAKMRVAHKGVPLSHSHKESLSASSRKAWRDGIFDREAFSEAMRAHAEKVLPNCRCFAHSRNSPTDIEILLCDLILADFPLVETQKQFGCYTVDAYLPPPYHLAFEADGEYWHCHPKKDAARDVYLLRKFGLPVVRLTGSEIKEAARG